MSFVDPRNSLPERLEWTEVAGHLDRFCSVLQSRARDFQTRVDAWYAQFCKLALPRLPLAMPYFVDLASLVLHAYPAFRRREEAPAEHRDYFDSYGRHLELLGVQPAVRMVQRRLAKCCPPQEAADRIVVRFVRQIMLWESRLWDRHRKQQADGPWVGAGLYLLRDADAIESFLKENVRIVTVYGAFRDAIPPLERFLLGAVSTTESARANDELIGRCIQSPDLDDRVYRPPPVITKAGPRAELSRRSGESANVRAVRRTTELRRLPDVVPHEFALLRAPKGGVRPFLFKMTQEGVSVWDRQHHVQRTHCNRVLACLVAAVGDTVNQAQSAFYLNPRVRGGGGAALRSDSPDTRARRLIFDFIRDLASAARFSPLQVDVHVHLEDYRRDCGHQWEMRSSDLEECLGGDRFDFMLELESMAPGYFFEGNLQGADGSHTVGEFIDRRVFAEGYDGKLIVLLGPSGAFRRVLRDRFQSRRRRRGSATIKVVSLATASDDLAVASVTAHGAVDFDYVPTDNMALRYSVVEAVFGRAGRGDSLRK
jgi:hypothetical protein